VIEWVVKTFGRPHLHIGDYMQRWFLLGSDADQTRIRIRIHRIMRSDAGRDLHDHPWWYLTIILRGGYWEHTHITDAEYCRATARGTLVVTGVTDDGFNIKKWYGRGSILFRRATARHRIEIPEGGEAWTLFTTGPKQREWGFWPKQGFIHWKDYEGQA
jgi:hypothetical protein